MKDNAQLANDQTKLICVPEVARRLTSTNSIAGVLVFSLAFLLVSTHATSKAPVATTLRNASSSPFVTIYANIIETGEQDATPADLTATADGGFVALALSYSTSTGVAWVLKLDPAGHVTWRREIGCTTGAPGDWALGVSIQQCSDQGYVVAGGVLGCGEESTRGLIEKLDPLGKVVWATAYPVGVLGTSINQIRQTIDGGYIAVGSAERRDLYSVALILKLDPDGNVEWQRQLGLTGPIHAYFNTVEQRSDGGYVAMGESYLRGTPLPHDSVTVVAFDTDGNVEWQQSYNNFDSHGSAINFEHSLAFTKTSDGGYLVGGNWVDETETVLGPLLLKLGSTGNIEWQQVYHVGGGLIYSLHQTSDGGYVAAGSGLSEVFDQIVPWMAKVDSSGTLLWQYLYYDVNADTGRPLSEWFPSSCLTNDSGIMALGWTENYDNGLGELYAVKTDDAGQIPGCAQVHTTTLSETLDPQVTAVPAMLSVDSTITPGTRIDIRSQKTSSAVRPRCRAD